MADTKIEVRSNGPYRITGPIEIVDQDGNSFSLPEGQWVAACRCGQSNNKPFCDGSHMRTGFQADTKA